MLQTRILIAHFIPTTKCTNSNVIKTRFSHEGRADFHVEPTPNCRISEFGQRRTQPIFRYMGTRVP